MRMWLGVAPYEMCRAHLLGEHRELHGLLCPPASWSVQRWRATLRGHLERQQIQPRAVWHWHETLVDEMQARGWPCGIRHESPITFADCIPLEEHCSALRLLHVLVDQEQSRADLAARCSECRERMGGGR